MRKTVVMTAAIVAAVVVWSWSRRRPRPATAERRRRPGPAARAPSPAPITSTARAPTARATRPGLLRAAARAGLQFVVFTDHGDGTRPPDPPATSSGVLCIDAVEISTNGGHYVALGMRRSAVSRSAGKPSAVVEDVRRLGGFGIVAHPDSPKPELAWSDWTRRADGSSG